MKKTIRIILLVCLFIAIILSSNKVKAASSSISASATTVTKGSNVTVSASVNAGAWNLTLSGNGQSKGLVGQTSTTDNASASTSISFTANSVGTYTFYLKGDISDYYTDATQDVNKSVTITVKEPSSSGNGSSQSGSGSSASSSTSSKSNSSASSSKSTSTKTVTNNTSAEEEKSNNAFLNSISIEKEGIVLVPEFANDVLEYSVSIPNDINELNIIATPEDEKATVEVKGNNELKVGENIITIEVTAEDGTKQIYTIKVIKAREKLALKTLILKYEDENGEIKELVLNPAFISNVYEYSLSDILSYKISKLIVEATANLEGATIEISGNENLVAGENIITITVRIPKDNLNKIEESEEIEDSKDLENPENTENIEEEVITYTIKFNKEETPSFWAKLKDKIKGIFGTIGNWFNDNQRPLIMGSLIACIVAMIGLSIYMVFDIKKYKMIIEKLGRVSEIISLENNAKIETSSSIPTQIQPEIINEESKIIEEKSSGLVEESIEEKASSKIDNILENIAKEKNIEIKEEPDDENILGKKRGRHF